MSTSYPCAFGTVSSSLDAGYTGFANEEVRRIVYRPHVTERVKRGFFSFWMGSQFGGSERRG